MVNSQFPTTNSQGECFETMCLGVGNWRWVLVLDSRSDRLAHLLGRRVAAEVWRVRTFFADHLDGVFNRARRLREAEVIQHQRRGPDCADGIGDVAAGDVL